MNILQEIAEKTRQRIEKEKQQISMELLLEKINKRSVHTAARISFKEALQAPGMSYICEVKKASPSKGLIAPYFPYLQIAREYAQAGAAAISCLTGGMHMLH